MAFTIRFSPEVNVEKLDEIARMHGLSRKALLDRLAMEVIEQGFVPRQPGEGFRASAPRGGFLALTQEDGYVASAENDLAEDERQVFEQARQMAKQGFWYPAKRMLLDSGFNLEMITVQK